MSTNWAKVLLFTLLGFALGWIMSCLMCAPCMGRSGCGDQACHAEAACGHGAAKGRCCKMGAADEQHGHAHEAIADSSHAH